MDNTNIVDQQKRADYFLYKRQIRAIQQISRETHRPSSEVVRDLLDEVLQSRLSKVQSQ